MDNNQLDRILRLVKRTGDKVVVLDRGSDTTVVLMDIDDYEYLLEASFGGEGDLSGPPKGEDMEMAQDWEEPEEIDETEKTEENRPTARPEPSKPLNNTLPFDAFDKEATQFEEGDQVNFDPEPVAEIPSPSSPEISLDKEEKIDDLPDDGEEERFYLEPV